MPRGICASPAIARVVARATPSRVMTLIAACVSISRRSSADILATSCSPLRRPARETPSDEGATLATICRHRPDHGIATHEMDLREVLAHLPGLGVPEPHPVTDRQVLRAAPG